MKENFDLLQMFANAGTLVNGSGGYINANDGTQEAFAGSNTLDGALKAFYDTELLENARAEMFYAQFAKKQPLPAGHGRTVEWRKWNTFEKAAKLEEGVIPTGQKFGMSSKTAAIEQYGTYAAVSDKLEMRAAVPHDSAPAMTHSSGRYITRITSDGIIGNNYTLEIFDLSGKLAYRGNFTGKLSAAASDASGDYIFVLAGNQVIRVNLYNKKIGSVTVEQDAIDVLPQDPDSFLLALKNYALTYDVTFDETYYERP